MNLNIDFKPQPWMNDGNCLNTDVDMTPDRLLVAGRRKNRTSPEALAAKNVCTGCPVSAKCLNYAFETDDRWGIYGGLTPLERDELTNPKPIKPASDSHHQRDRTHCNHNHEFTPENTHIDKRGWRSCRTCTRLRDEKRRQKDAA